MLKKTTYEKKTMTNMTNTKSVGSGGVWPKLSNWQRLTFYPTNESNVGAPTESHQTQCGDSWFTLSKLKIGYFGEEGEGGRDFYISENMRTAHLALVSPWSHAQHTRQDQSNNIERLADWFFLKATGRTIYSLRTETKIKSTNNK